MNVYMSKYLFNVLYSALDKILSDIDKTKVEKFIDNEEACALFDLFEKLDKIKKKMN